jgi:hypothetical protein
MKGFMMKRNNWSALFIFALATFLFCTAANFPAHGAAKGRVAEDEGFSVKEYAHFHAVLHPLQHDALPKNDFKTIRAKAGDLLTLGDAILQLGVPEGVEEKNVKDFTEWLNKFGNALAKFRTDVKGGTDDELKESYLAVHDSFEMLAAMLPKNKA